MTAIHARQPGFSLIELMIAMLIGLLLTGATFSVYLENRKSSRSAEIIARMQDSARFALEILTHDIRLAGFYGKNIQPTEIRGIRGDAHLLPNVVNDCAPGWYRDLPAFIWATDNVNGYTSCVSDYADDTDILVVRYADTRTVGEAAIGTYATPPNQVDGLDNADKDELIGKVLLRTSPLAGELFLDPYQPPTTFSGVFEDRVLMTRIYHVRPFFMDANDQIPTLVVEELSDGGVAPLLKSEVVAPGIEQLQIQFAIDADRDGTVDFYRDPEEDDTPDEFTPDQVVAVRIWLLARAEASELDVADPPHYSLGTTTFVPDRSGFRRMLFTTTVDLRNNKP